MAEEKIPVAKPQPVLRPVNGSVAGGDQAGGSQIPAIKSAAMLRAAQGQQDNAVPISDVTKGVPFRGGMFTDRDVSLIPSGGYSMIQNMRATHPGFEKRKGCAKHHSVADGTNEVMSLFQYSKGKVTERHFYAQMSDGDVLEATDNPPGTTVGAFGSEVFDGTATGQVPASWGVLDDKLIYSNGSDMHQIYSGDDHPVSRVIVYIGTSAPPIIPTEGKDYTEQATDGLDSTYIDLSSLGDLSTDYDCIFVCTHIPATSITWTMASVNSTASVAAGKYWNGAWTAMSGFSDGTSDGGKAFAKTGTQSWTAPTDEIPHYMFGQNGFWYQIYLSSGDLDSDTKASALVYNTTWQPLRHIWDGVLVDVVETQFYDQSDGTYYTYGATSIDISEGTSSDAIYIASLDPIVGFYVDVGETPNTTGSTAIDHVYYWQNGNTWTDVTSMNDGTSGFSKSGFVTFKRQSDVFKQQFGGLDYHLYWYKITWNQTLSEDVQIGIRTMPYFDIAEYGQKGTVSCIWRNRLVCCFDRWPVDVYVSARHSPMVFNGDDATLLERPGDGRLNKVVAIKPFFNNILVFQEEKGTEGGCVTMYQGYDPATFGKLLLSTRLGTFSQKSVAVVEGITTGTNKLVDKPTTVAFFLSHYGVFMCEGTTFIRISKQEHTSIQNYFDPKSADCIRRGYEDKCWLAYDSAYHVLRVGLVTGSSATTPNTFLVYDIEDRAWMADSPAQPFSCLCEVEAASGDVAVLQYAGGTADGTVYRTNYTTDDVSTAIDAYVTMEVDGDGAEIWMRELILRNTGTATMTAYLDGVAQTPITIT